MTKQDPSFISLRKTVASYIDKYPTPNKEWNKEQIRELQSLTEGSKEHNDLRSTIALANGGFGMKYVMNYKKVLNEDASVLDLFQEAMIGILEAIDAFDLDKKTTFTTYAHYQVRKRIVDFIKKNKVVKAPRDIARNMRHVQDATDTLHTRLMREPDAAEITVYLKKECNIVIKEHILISIMCLLDLNSSGTEESFISEYNDQLSLDEEKGLFKKMEISINKELVTCDETSAEAAQLRFGIGREYPHAPEEVRLLLNTKVDFNIP